MNSYVSDDSSMYGSQMQPPAPAAQQQPVEAAPLPPMEEDMLAYR